MHGIDLMCCLGLSTWSVCLPDQEFHLSSPFAPGRRGEREKQACFIIYHEIVLSKSYFKEGGF